jgi:hypothetical protein
MSCDFDEKVYLYKTAYTHLYETYVSIKKVKKVDNKMYVFYCSMWDKEKKEMIDMIFSEYELSNFCL